MLARGHKTCGALPHAPKLWRYKIIPRRQLFRSIAGKISSRAEPPQAVPKAPLTDFSRLCFITVKRRGYKFSRAVPLPGGRGGGVGRTLLYLI